MRTYSPRGTPVCCSGRRHGIAISVVVPCPVSWPMDLSPVLVTFCFCVDPKFFFSCVVFFSFACSVKDVFPFRHLLGWMIAGRITLIISAVFLVFGQGRISLPTLARLRNFRTHFPGYVNFLYLDEVDSTVPRYARLRMHFTSCIFLGCVISGRISLVTSTAFFSVYSLLVFLHEE